MKAPCWFCHPHAKRGSVEPMSILPMKKAGLTNSAMVILLDGSFLT